MERQPHGTDQSCGDFRAGGAGGYYGEQGLRPQYQHPAGAAPGHRRPDYGIQGQYDHSPDCGESDCQGDAGREPGRSRRASGA